MKQSGSTGLKLSALSEEELSLIERKSSEEEDKINDEPKHAYDDVEDLRFENVDRTNFSEKTAYA